MKVGPWSHLLCNPADQSHLNTSARIATRCSSGGLKHRMSEKIQVLRCLKTSHFARHPGSDLMVHLGPASIEIVSSRQDLDRVTLVLPLPACQVTRQHLP